MTHEFEKAIVGATIVTTILGASDVEAENVNQAALSALNNQEKAALIKLNGELQIPEQAASHESVGLQRTVLYDVYAFNEQAINAFGATDTNFITKNDLQANVDTVLGVSLIDLELDAQVTRIRESEILNGDQFSQLKVGLDVIRSGDNYLAIPTVRTPNGGLVISWTENDESKAIVFEDQDGEGGEIVSFLMLKSQDSLEVPDQAWPAKFIVSPDGTQIPTQVFTIEGGGNGLPVYLTTVKAETARVRNWENIDEIVGSLRKGDAVLVFGDDRQRMENFYLAQIYDPRTNKIGATADALLNELTRPQASGGENLNNPENLSNSVALTREELTQASNYFVTQGLEGEAISFNQGFEFEVNGSHVTVLSNLEIDPFGPFMTENFRRVLEKANKSLPGNLIWRLRQVGNDRFSYGATSNGFMEPLWSSNGTIIVAFEEEETLEDGTVVRTILFTDEFIRTRNSVYTTDDGFDIDLLGLAINDVLVTSVVGTPTQNVEMGQAGAFTELYNENFPGFTLVTIDRH